MRMHVPFAMVVIIVSAQVLAQPAAQTTITTVPATTTTPAAATTTTTTTTTTPVVPATTEVITSTTSDPISGNYKCTVFDPSKNSRYQELITIKKSGDTYNLQYFSIDNPIPYLFGTAIYKDNTIAAVNWDAGTSGWVGTLIFQVNPDGSLNGNWATKNKTIAGSESCTKS